jgi:hypothetical protein
MINYDLVINPETIMKLYQKSSEFVIWEVATISRELRKKKAKVAQEIKVKTKAVASDKDRDVIKMSVANAGLLKKNKTKKKPKGKFVGPENPQMRKWADAESVEVTSKLQEPFESLGRPRTNSNPSVSFQGLQDMRKRPESASPVMSRQASAAAKPKTADNGSPQPHHFNHPEKHVDPTLIKSGLVRSRSSSMTNLFETLRPKIPPSPHHHNHPLKTLSRNDSSKDKKRLNSAPKVKVEVISGKHRKPKWSAEADWENLAKFEAARRENDNPIECRQEKPLTERKKGDALHIPLGKINIDLASLFAGNQKATFKTNKSIELINNCSLTLALESPLLSPDYVKVLNPMMITLSSLNGMPDQPVPYDVLDEICEPFNANFRFFSDPLLHSVILDSPRSKDVPLNSQHLILVGLLNPKKLYESIRKTPFQVQIHDRDYKYRKEENISNNNFYDTGIIQSNLNPFNPYGVANLGMLF